jgi:hypothetical protein
MSLTESLYVPCRLIAFIVPTMIFSTVLSDR